MSLVERAVRRTLEAHAGQKEENGRPYLARLGARETRRLKRYFEAHRLLSKAGR